jgi:hypothetical protein
MKLLGKGGRLMVAKRMASAGIRAIGIAPLLLGMSLVAAPSAEAQPEDLPDPADLACIVYEGLIDAGGLETGALEGQCVELGCDPSEKDCTKFCKTARKGCDKAGKASAKVFKTFGKAEIKAAKTLCKTAADPKACKQIVKEIGKALKELEKQFRRNAKDVCEAEGIQSDCSASCNTGAAFPTCGG